jgi:phospho-N-acetylmuramoyl-pentapeptide-transferase
VLLNIDQLRQLLDATVLSLVFSFIIAFPIIHILYKFNITRRLDYDFTTLIEKRNMKAGVPIMGGLIIVISVIVLNILFNPAKDISDRAYESILLLLGMFGLSALLGGIDDILNIYGKKRKQRALSVTLRLIRVHKSKWKRIWLAITFPWEAYKRFFFILGSNPGRGIHAHEKILVQSISGLALGLGIYFYSSRSNPGEFWIPILDFTIDIGILIIPFAWITVLLMTNAVNLADGMDGLAAGKLFVSFFGFLILSIIKQDFRIAFLIATVLGSLVTYLYFNVPPARFQMGDVGSLSLGTLLAAVGFLLGEPMMLLFISFPFALTLLSSVIQGIGRRIIGRRIFRMAPLHHHLQIAKNWSEEKVVIRLVLFSVACVLFSLWIYFNQSL